MKWERWGDYAVRCLDWQMSISKAKVFDLWIYTVWKMPKTEREPGIMLGHYKTFDAAKLAAKDFIEDEREQGR